MSQAAPPPDPATREELAEAVASAQVELAEGVRRGDLTRDPYRFVIGALSATVGLFPRLVERMEAAAEAARAPLSSEDKAALRRDVREGLRQEAGKLASATVRRTAIFAGVAVAGAGLAGGVGGFFLGRAGVRDDVVMLSGRLSMDAGAARAWSDLVRANPDPRPAMAAGTAWQDPATQRRAIELRLWTDLPSAAAPPRR